MTGLNMDCPVCKTDEHDLSTCPHGKSMAVKPEDSHVLWVKFDNITSKQADELLKATIDIKSTIAPDARGTFAKGTKKEMPQKIAEALGVQSEVVDGTKKIK